MTSPAPFSLDQLLAMVDGDRELITHLVEEQIIEIHDDRAVVDVEQVMVAKTLWRELEIEWPGIDVILRMRGELAAARRRIAELEAEIAGR